MFTSIIAALAVDSVSKAFALGACTSLTAYVAVKNNKK